MSSDARRNTDDRSELASAIGFYVLGDISLGKAAEKAGVSRWKMEGLLRRAGIDPNLGPQNEAELQAEIEAALDVE